MSRQFEHILTYWKSIRDLLLTIYAYKKPLVAIINGHANGVGSELTMAADYRVMKEGASMERNEYDSRGQQCCQRVGDEIFGSVRSKLISANDAFRAGTFRYTVFTQPLFSSEKYSITIYQVLSME